MPEFTQEVQGRLIAGGLVLLLLVIAVIVLVILCIRGQQKLRQMMQDEQARTENDLRRQWELLHGIPGREEMDQKLYNLQEALRRGMTEIGESDARRAENLGARLDAFGAQQQDRLEHVTVSVEEKLRQNEARIETMRRAVEESMKSLREENAAKLEEMRRTVDEKLHATLDKRLSDSFSMVSERLEQVYKGLGEMRTLAGGVGDLKKVLSNVKTRGIWGEMQLGNILSQMMAPGQYAENCEVVPNSGRRVEYAILLPGRETERVYLPIDSKFPVEDYERLLAAAESGDPQQIQACAAGLEAAFKAEAKRISEKYICPPYTTDFAVMFVPVEGLYAEALQRRGLAEHLQEKFRIIIAGPTTLTALLNSLQVGFRTLAIEKRSGEVWQLLGAVKTEFGHFNDLLDATQKRMQSVTETIEKAGRRSRMIERRLKDVESLDESGAVALLGKGEITDTDPVNDQY